jgi:hypothetical protein
MYCTVPTITPAAVTAAAAVFAVELVATAGLVALANPKSSSADVRMIVRGNGACFALEAFARVRIGSHVRRQHFDRHCAIKPGVAGLVHLSHAARAAAGQQLIRTHTPPIVQPDGAQNVQHARGGRFEEPSSSSDAASRLSTSRRNASFPAQVSSRNAPLSSGGCARARSKRSFVRGQSSGRRLIAECPRFRAIPNPGSVV